MRKRFVLMSGIHIVLFLFLFSNVRAQVAEQWHRINVAPDVGGDFPYFRYTAIAKDLAGNVYVTGYGVRTGGTVQEPENYFFTRKYNPNGSLEWETKGSFFEPQFGETRDWNFIPSSIVVGPSGYTYIAGTLVKADFTPLDGYIFKYDPDGSSPAGFEHARALGPKSPQRIALDASENVYVGCNSISTPGECSSILKYSSGFDFFWSKSCNDFPADLSGHLSGFAVDDYGNIYITGYSAESGNGLDFSTTVLNTMGDFLYRKTYNSANNNDDKANSIAMDASGNIYITGVSKEPSGNEFYTTIKYNNSLEEQWVRTYDGLAGSLQDEARNIVASLGNVYVNGVSGADIATLKYNENGDELWVRRYIGTSVSINDVAMDALGNIYLTGRIFGGNSDFDILTLKYDKAGNEVWQITYTTGNLTSVDAANAMVIDNSGAVYVAGIANDEDAILIKYIQCTLSCPGNITGNNAPNQCGALVSYPNASGTSICGTLQYSIPSGSFFPVGTTTVTVSSQTGQEVCSFDITIKDVQKPVITNCPSNVTVSCAADIPLPDINSVSATDNCSVVVTHEGDIVSNEICANKFTLTRTYVATDPGGNTATCSQIITVNDNTPPQITGLNVSQQSLWPPNHTMRDITVNYTATDNCVGSPIVTVTVSSNEPVNGTADGDTDPDWEIIDDHHVRLRAERAANGNGRIYTITITVNDGCNPPVSQTKEVVVVHNITAPQSGKPFKIGSTVNFSGEFWDKPTNKHTAKWLIDENTIVKGIVTEPAGTKNGQVTGSYKFTSAGVYKLQMNISDQNGITSYANTNGDLEAIIVIYDPNGGHTYGGGYYNSPAGALRSNPTATGKASYGFAMNYFKNSTNPKGETQFEFKVGDFEFNALNFDYLVISNSMAQFKGTGKIIGGQSGIGFTMTVTDGQLDGTGIDKIRMKIYNKNNGSVIYDNQPGASDAALPIQAVGVNSSIVISGTNSSLTSANTNQKGEMEAKVAEVSDDLDVIAFPNPSATNFTISIKANTTKEKITMHVVDMYGRVIETRNINSSVRFGDRYKAGTYFVRIIRGREHKELKLVKLSD